MASDSAATDFTRQKLCWLDQIADEGSLSPAAFKLAYVLSRHFNRETRDAWPTQQTLAAAVCMSERNVRKLVDELVSAGHLDVIEARGRGHSNRYRMVLKRGTDVPLSSPEKGNHSSGFDHLKEEEPFRFSKAKTGNFAQENRKNRVRKPEPQFLQNTIKNTIRNTISPVSTKQAAEAAPSILDQDPKRVLFGDGLKWLASATERTDQQTRAVIGKMLQAAHNDASHVLAAVMDAKHNNRADPIPWIMARLRPASPRAPPPGVVPSTFKLSKPAVRA